LTPGLGDASVGVANGLSASTGVDSNADGYIDDVYAGDLKGNVWKFNLTKNFANKGDWIVENGDKPLFKAVDSLGTPQPISGGINVGFNYLNDTWLFFGTGRLMTATDLTSKAVQTWYGFIDKGKTVTRTDFVQRSIVDVQSSGEKVSARAFSTRVNGDMVDGNGNPAMGWYIDLTYDAVTETPKNKLSITPRKQGERIVGIPLIRGTLLQVSTIIPSDLECDTGGNGFVNVVDAFTGSAGYAGDDAFLDANFSGFYYDDKIGDPQTGKNIGSVDLGVNMPTDGLIQTNGDDDLLIVSGSTGGIGSIPVKATRVQGRVSWREITSD
jgi:type IV pilus assembly protein PilY1